MSESQKVILEYLRIMLTLPVLAFVGISWFIIYFRNQIRGFLRSLEKRKIDTPWGSVGEGQSDKIRNGEEKDRPKPKESKDLPEEAKGIKLDPKVSSIIKSLQAEKYLWEYRYLNYFLVYATQTVLDWLYALKENPTVSLYNAIWARIIPKIEERTAILDALKEHTLITIKSDVIEITPKGREYKEWRGPLPPLK